MYYVMKKIKTLFLLLVLTFSASAFADSPKKVTTEEPTTIVKEEPTEDKGSFQKMGIWDG